MFDRRESFGETARQPGLARDAQRVSHREPLDRGQRERSARDDGVRVVEDGACRRRRARLHVVPERRKRIAPKRSPDRWQRGVAEPAVDERIECLDNDGWRRGVQPPHRLQVREERLFGLPEQTLNGAMRHWRAQRALDLVDLCVQVGLDPKWFGRQRDQPEKLGLSPTVAVRRRADNGGERRLCAVPTLRSEGKKHVFGRPPRGQRGVQPRVEQLEHTLRAQPPGRSFIERQPECRQEQRRLDGFESAGVRAREEVPCQALERLAAARRPRSGVLRKPCDPAHQQLVESREHRRAMPAGRSGTSGRLAPEEIQLSPGLRHGGQALSQRGVGRVGTRGVGAARRRDEPGPLIRRQARGGVPRGDNGRPQHCRQRDGGETMGAGPQRKGLRSLNGPRSPAAPGRLEA